MNIPDSHFQGSIGISSIDSFHNYASANTVERSYFLTKAPFYEKKTLNLDKVIYKLGQNLSALNICESIDTI